MPGPHPLPAGAPPVGDGLGRPPSQGVGQALVDGQRPCTPPAAPPARPSPARPPAPPRPAARAPARQHPLQRRPHQPHRPRASQPRPGFGASSRRASAASSRRPASRSPGRKASAAPATSSSSRLRSSRTSHRCTRSTTASTRRATPRPALFRRRCSRRGLEHSQPRRCGRGSAGRAAWPTPLGLPAGRAMPFGMERCGGGRQRPSGCSHALAWAPGRRKMKKSAPAGACPLRLWR